MSFTAYKVPLTSHQISKLRKSIETSTPVKFRLNLSQLTTGDGIPILMTKSQINKISKAIKSNKGMMLNMSQTQVRFNKKHGGFLPILIPIAIAAATALATGAASALAGFATTKGLEAIEKAVEGEGLFPQGSSGQGLAPLGTPVKGGEFIKIPGTELVVRKGFGLFPQGVKPN